MRSRSVLVVAPFMLSTPLFLLPPEREPLHGREASTTADSVEIREWDVPWGGTRPRDPFVDPSGKVWFVGQRGNYVGALDPASGEFRRIELPPGANRIRRGHTNGPIRVVLPERYLEQLDDLTPPADHDVARLSGG